MGFFDFLKKTENEQMNEKKSIDQVLNEIQEEYGYIDDIEENEENIEQEECIEIEEYEEQEGQEINIKLEKYYDEKQSENIEQEIRDLDIEKLYDKLGQLGRKYEKDLDVVCLKALCETSETEESIQAILETLQNLVKKYPNDEKILELLSTSKEKEIKVLSLDELIKVLETRYTGTEMVMIKALVKNTRGVEKENAIRKCLKELSLKNPLDEDIIAYLDTLKERNKNMIFLKGVTWVEANAKRKLESGEISEEEIDDKKEEMERNIEENMIEKLDEKAAEELKIELEDETVELLKEVFRKIFLSKRINLFVGKEKVTQKEWKKYMITNPSSKVGEKNPIDSITWIEALKFCNKMSEYYGYEPAYKIDKNRLYKIVYRDKTEINPENADFSKVEGYRLPTVCEMLNIYGVPFNNSDYYEWCYDSLIDREDIKEIFDTFIADKDNESIMRNAIKFIKRKYVYNNSDEKRIVFTTSNVNNDDSKKYYEKSENISFRIVRTANCQ